jgi:CAAX prenyl protease-like protein
MLLRLFQQYRWLPFVLPLSLFLLLTSFEQALGSSFYPLIYSVKTIMLAGILWRTRSIYSDLNRNSQGVSIGLLLGPALTVGWVVIDRYTPHFRFMGARSAYDPFTAIHNVPLCWLFIAVRFFGLTMIAPIIEELFYRAFLPRLVINQNNFISVPLGQFDTPAFIAVVVLMASSHPEYLAAAVFSAVMNLILMKTRNLWATVAAHGSTNFFLGVYVLVFHAWKYW